VAVHWVADPDARGGSDTSAYGGRYHFGPLDLMGRYQVVILEGLRETEVRTVTLKPGYQTVAVFTLDPTVERIPSAEPMPIDTEL
jgi:hypothetical protein